jgi:hypothetical protein
MMMTQSDVDAPCWRAGLYHLPTRNDQPEEVCERQPGRSELLETCARQRFQTDTVQHGAGVRGSCYAIGGYFRKICSSLTILPMYLQYYCSEV